MKGVSAVRKLAINLHAKAGLDTATYIATMKQVGFEALFTNTPSRTELDVIANALAANGMHYEMIHAPFGHINDIWLAGERGDAMLREMLDAVDAAAAAGGVPIVVIHLSSGKTPPAVSEVGCARYDRLVDYAAKKGVRLAFENQRFLFNFEWAMRRFANAPHVGFCWDCGHEGCFTPDVAFMPDYGKRLLGTHLHDNSRLPDADDHKIPFDGRINFSHVAQQIRGSGYKGTLTLEVFAGNSRSYDQMTCTAFLEQAAIAAKRIRRMVDGFDWS